MRWMTFGLVALSFAIAAPTVAAEETITPRRSALIISERAVASALTLAPATNPSSSRDSIKNGAVIGAIVGGASAAVFTGALCHALHEPGDPPCWRGVTAISALFAGVGAAAGAGIDAVFTRNSRVVLVRLRR